LINNFFINIFEDGKESRDFVFIGDVVNATIAGIENDIGENISINVGTGISTSVYTVAQLLKLLYNSNSEINISGNYRLGDVRHNIADISLYKREIEI
jgi:dTDP-L-rhamnose 4-epimerase